MAGLIACAAWFAYWQFARLAGAQTPRVYYDSQAYLQIAARPVGLARLYDYKPPLVPLIDGVAGGDPVAIRAIQVAVAMLAWSVLALALARALRRTWVRALAVFVAIAFLLAAPRIGWTGAVLSESINDSLLALVVGGLLTIVTLAPGRARLAVALATGVAVVGWLMTRDTNAVTALVAIGLAAIAWRPWSRRGLALAAVALVGAVVALWATRVTPEPLPFQRGWWTPQLTARAHYPIANNLLTRVLPDDRAWLVERGAPVADLERLKFPDKLVGIAPENVAAQDWVAHDGAGTYVRWLLRHPGDRLAELGGDWVTLLVGRHAGSMPEGWVASGHGAVEALRRLTTNRYLVLALLLASPVLVFRPRRDPRRALALILVASGLVGAVAAYYGDAAELSRHCYGSGQQIALGLFLALLARLDAIEVPARWRRA